MKKIILGLLLFILYGCALGKIDVPVIGNETGVVKDNVTEAGVIKDNKTDINTEARVAAVDNSQNSKMSVGGNVINSDDLIKYVFNKFGDVVIYVVGGMFVMINILLTVLAGAFTKLFAVISHRNNLENSKEEYKKKYEDMLQKYDLNKNGKIDDLEIGDH